MDDRILALVNCSLIDGRGRAPLRGAAIHIRGDRIIAAGPAAEVPLPPGPHEILDLQSQFVLPGLMDAHVHLTLEGGPSATFEHDEAYTLLATLKQAQRTLAAGFTTVRDLGGRNYVEFVVRRAIEDGLFQGPRLVLAGKIVSMTSPGADYWPGMYAEADGPDAVRRAAREQLKRGADVIKLMATGSAMTPGEQPAPQYTVEEMRAAVDEAHKAGKPASAHATGIQGIRNALEAGVDHIEHGSYLHEDPQAVESMAQRGVWLVPTCKVFQVVVERGEAAGIPGWMVEQNRLEAESNLRSLRAAVAAGVPIALGTDAGGPLNFHGENAGELAYLVQAGLSPLEAIQAATWNAARCVGLADRAGSLEPGKWADLIVVREDPLRDICVLARPECISLVLKGGEPVARSPLASAELRPA
jgi:imidazolonepropionase-like amidohydrolase